jgi:antirestriction protein ArdC
MEKEKMQEIVKQLEDGVKDVLDSGKWADYLTFMSRFTNYSANNTLLIWMQMPTASLVAGYKAWQSKFGRQVKKGAKGIHILAPCPHKVKKEVRNEDGSTEEVEAVYTSYKSIAVFDVSQTEGEELPQMVKLLDGTVEGYNGLIDKLKLVCPVSVYFEGIDGTANGFYSDKDKRVVVKEGLPQLQTVKTLVHEIAHALLHCKDGEQSDADRRTMEVQAEGTAYCVCQYLGLDTSDYSFGYIAGWGSGKEAKELLGSVEVIRKTAAEIISKIAA